MTTIEKLLILQERDRRIRDLARDTEQIPARKKLSEATLQQYKATAEASQSLLKHNATAIKAVELEVETQRQRIGKLRVQQNTVRTNDEYRAIEKEIAMVEKIIRTEEDKALALMEEAEGLRTNLAMQEQRVKEEQKTVDSDSHALEQRLAGIRDEIARLQTERAAMEKEIDADWLNRYTRIFKHLGDFALVPVEGGSCGGCHMKIPPHLIQDAKRSGTMTTCSYCGRLLYWRS
ncbi:MAG: C4-type zinc ribbon domain-containing protein [Kiritimatiellae bacterium]|nr:C4-type zinc ribbon domain-containing protein [Kiritimatiellia bacterium]MCO5061312.1 C4-type zinc ribbon domain-containing protein [Kiritimatiellia bacterium]MCO6400178.1 hypothetical protein [Verrucomicrobiota bacterium]